MESDKYYYFPMGTKNILFVRDEQYIYVSKLEFNLFQYLNTYTCDSFENGNALKLIIFRDNLGNFYRASAFDGGYFMSLKQYRKRKLEKLAKLNEKT